MIVNRSLLVFVWLFVAAVFGSGVALALRKGDQLEQQREQQSVLQFLVRCDQLGGTVARVGTESLCVQRQSILDMRSR